jgi:TPR repeat protein
MEALAWILASSHDGGARDPAEAVRWSRRAAELTQRQVPAVLDVLAASYAAAGELERAVATAEEASRLALAVGRTGLAAVIEDRLALYRQRKPYVRPRPR